MVSTSIMNFCFNWSETEKWGYDETWTLEKQYVLLLSILNLKLVILESRALSPEKAWYFFPTKTLSPEKGMFITFQQKSCHQKKKSGKLFLIIIETMCCAFIPHSIWKIKVTLGSELILMLILCLECWFVIFAWILE